MKNRASDSSHGDDGSAQRQALEAHERQPQVVREEVEALEVRDEASWRSLSPRPALRWLRRALAPSCSQNEMSSRTTVTEAKIDVQMPIVSVTAKPRIGPEPEPEHDERRRPAW